MNTKYTVFVDDDALDTTTRSTKATVIAKADEIRKSGVKTRIEVRTQAGTVVHALPAIKTRVVTKHTKPWTKTVEVPAALRKHVLKGYVVAYTRPTNDTAVLRSTKAPKTEAYVVTRLSTGEVLGYAPTTRDAGAIQAAQSVKKVAANA